MLAFTPDQWLILLLAFVLGLILGMAFLASPKWKRRYREEVAAPRGGSRPRTSSCAATPARWTSLRHAAARDEARHDERREDRPGPL